jgi:hypothetical protein
MAPKLCVPELAKVFCQTVFCEFASEGTKLLENLILPPVLKKYLIADEDGHVTVISLLIELLQLPTNIVGARVDPV